ncbi:MAG: aminomethyl-transferring glycine dehydrogenase subunit GcvPB [Candidatus Hydrogenedentes bacterium]|nr:aminomethyl-transferring glycine dehydrogenase subunit GcvPB [Candidatus Hydrogenedentota bacterium]
MQLIFEKSREGRRGVTLDALDVPLASLPAELCREQPAALPQVSEFDVVRHFTELSSLNYGLDAYFYPLGSCTMKYNPKIAEAVAGLAGFSALHPHLASTESTWSQCQGAFELIYETECLLAEIAGMTACSLQPIAGAHGELAGVLLMAAYHRDKGNAKNKIIIPDSAHGTNPASAAIAGYDIVEIPSNDRGTIDLDSFKAALDDSVAGVMATCPNTHGLFEPDIHEIARLAHEADALMYYDGANLNAILGECRPGDLGFDVMHYNLHKTFATPHGMGGPGSGPVGVGERLAPYLPGPRVVKTDGAFALDTPGKSIGNMAPFFGNFGMAVRAYAYIRQLGSEGLRDVSHAAVLNANYIHARLKNAYRSAFDGAFMHECVFDATPQANKGTNAMDIAKALLDYGFHAPTVYFPLTVHESLMIEPTETESKETIDAFCDAMLEIAARVEEEGDPFKDAPRTTPVGRLDEVKAARDLDCAYLEPASAIAP